MKSLLKNKNFSRIALVVLIVLGSYLYERYVDQPITATADNALQQAISNQRSDVQVEGIGTIVKVLPDDTKGSQHQKLLG